MHIQLPVANTKLSAITLVVWATPTTACGTFLPCSIPRTNVGTTLLLFPPTPLASSAQKCAVRTYPVVTCTTDFVLSSPATSVGANPPASLLMPPRCLQLANVQAAVPCPGVLNPHGRTLALMRVHKPYAFTHNV